MASIRTRCPGLIDRPAAQVGGGGGGGAVTPPPQGRTVPETPLRPRPVGFRTEMVRPAEKPVTAEGKRIKERAAEGGGFLLCDY